MRERHHLLESRCILLGNGGQTLNYPHKNSLRINGQQMLVTLPMTAGG
jgi:hypothetical protein